jgi:hypothetical protein
MRGGPYLEHSSRCGKELTRHIPRTLPPDWSASSVIAVPREILTTEKENKENDKDKEAPVKATLEAVVVGH